MTIDVSALATPAEIVEALQNQLIERATHGIYDQATYRELRRLVLDDLALGSRVPAYVRTCASLDQFWLWIKRRAGTYEERRTLIWDDFRPLLDSLSGTGVRPADADVSEALVRFDEENVHAVWRKALDRRATDPEGAITAARTLLESVCKHILDRRGTPYPDDADLPKLYGLAARELRLAPSQHTEDSFKQILGGCHSVVQGLASVRNRLSDAHGQGRKLVRPAPRHAELAVNLAGGMALFLVATLEAGDTAS